MCGDDGEVHPIVCCCICGCIVVVLIVIGSTPDFSFDAFRNIATGFGAVILALCVFGAMMGVGADTETTYLDLDGREVAVVHDRIYPGRDISRVDIHEIRIA